MLRKSCLNFQRGLSCTKLLFVLLMELWTSDVSLSSGAMCSCHDSIPYLSIWCTLSTYSRKRFCRCWDVLQLFGLPTINLEYCSFVFNSTTTICNFLSSVFIIYPFLHKNQLLATFLSFTCYFCILAVASLIPLLKFIYPISILWFRFYQMFTQ